MTYQTLQQAAETRRSIYALNKNLPVSNEEISEIVKHAVLHTPSSFNSQSTRVVVLFGEEHGKVWQFVEDALRAIVPAEQFEPTAQKLNLFKAGAATILFFEDQNVVKGLQEQFPSYAARCPTPPSPKNGTCPKAGFCARKWLSAASKRLPVKKPSNRWKTV